MTTLWLVRHARVLAPAGLCYGATDLPADEQATREAAHALARVLPHALPVHCSPLRRCAQLAQALQDLRPDLVPRPDARLAEMDFGRWEGQRWDALGVDAFSSWMADFAGYRCGGGESVAQLMTRVALAWDEARATDSERVWITHAGVARAARLLARGVACPRQADEWPEDALECGAWNALPLGHRKAP